jgi:thiosulfate dehydrogenase
MQNEQAENKLSQGLVSIINKLLIVIVVLVIGLISVPFILYYNNQPDKPAEKKQDIVTSKEIVKKEVIAWWKPVDINNISDPGLKEQVNYGKDLIAHTSKYLGPNGSVLKISNGMNCQNCHLQAGTAVFGNNYGSVASLYPKFRARSGTIENIYKRVNDCFERSLNGKALDPM